MKHTSKTRQRVRWMPDKDTERNGLQTLLAFAYGMQVGRSRRLAVELQRLAEQALVASMASGAAIAIASDDRIECIARAGELAPQLGSRPESGLSNECIRTGISQICADTETDQALDRIPSRTSVRSVVYVPLFRGSQPAGVIGVFSDKPGHFTEHDLRVLNLIGREVTKILKWQPPAFSELPSSPSAPAAARAAEDDAEAPQIPANPAASSKDVVSAAIGIQSREPTFALLGDAGRSPHEATASRLQFASLEFSEEGRFRRWSIITAVVIAVFMILGAGAAKWLLKSPQQDAFPMVYGPPQVTTDSPLPSLTQNLSVPADASADTSSASTSLPSAPVVTTPVSSATIAPIRSQIETVRIQAAGAHTFVSIYLSGGAQFRVHQLKSPDRIYVDFEGVAVSPQMKAAKIDGAGSVGQFRFAKSANTARLVMVLENPCTYMVSVTSNPHVIVFDLQPRL